MSFPAHNRSSNTALTWLTAAFHSQPFSTTFNHPAVAKPSVSCGERPVFPATPWQKKILPTTQPPRLSSAHTS